MFLLAIWKTLAFLTDAGVYYPTGTMFCSSELLIISKAEL